MQSKHFSPLLPILSDAQLQVCKQLVAKMNNDDLTKADEKFHKEWTQCNAIWDNDAITTDERNAVEIRGYHVIRKIWLDVIQEEIKRRNISLAEIGYPFERWNSERDAAFNDAVTMLALTPTPDAPIKHIPFSDNK